MTEGLRTDELAAYGRELDFKRSIGAHDPERSARAAFDSYSQTSNVGS